MPINIQIADYSTRECSPGVLDDLRAIANINLRDLHKERKPGLLIFPDSFDYFDSGLGEHHICSIHENTLRAYSLVGFVGNKGTRLSIHSRFAQDETGKEDFFLHYMLCRIAKLNLVDLRHALNLQHAIDFLPFMFPLFLKKAIAQGISRQYVTRRANNANLKGRIDVGRHLRSNLPFRGAIAYDYREFSADNPLMQLVRHTLEHIRKLPHGILLLNGDKTIRDAASEIVRMTPSYFEYERQRIISQNSTCRPHPHFSAYQPLQRLCLRILRHEQAKYGESDTEIYGLLIDAAWLWEEYLAEILADKFSHYTQRSQKLSLFTNGQQRFIPDFVRRHRDGNTIADAKYIRLNGRNDYFEEKATAIYYKTITYMYCFHSEKGFLIYPLDESHPGIGNPQSLRIQRYEPKKAGAILIKLGLNIPGNCKSFQEFCGRMAASETELVAQLCPC